MRILIALAALPLIAAAQPGAKVRAHCALGPQMAGATDKARPRTLGELPPGKPFRAVYRIEDGCPTPVAMPVNVRRR